MAQIITHQFGGRASETITGAKTLKKTDNGKLFFLDAAAGATVTLPALDEGLEFEFIVASSFATTNWVIDSAEGDNIYGAIADLGTSHAAVIAAAEDQVNFVASAETVGDRVKLVANADNSQWLLTGFCAANGGITVTDPS